MPDPVLTAEPHFYAKAIWIPLALCVPSAVIGLVITFAFRQAQGFTKKSVIRSLEAELRFLESCRDNPTGAMGLLATRHASSTFAIALMLQGIFLWLVGQSLKPLAVQAGIMLLGSLLVGVGAGEASALRVLAKRTENALAAPEKVIQRVQARLERLSK